MTLTALKELVRTCGLPYGQAAVTWKSDFDKVFQAEKNRLCNLTDKLNLLKDPVAEAEIQKVITKLRDATQVFDKSDVPDLSKFVARVNGIIKVTDRLNNFKQGVALDQGVSLDLAELFNQIKVTERLTDFTMVLNKNLKSFLPHLYSVVKHCQAPAQYPIFYKYWRNIMREVYRLPDDYDSMVAFYQNLPVDDRHLRFATYLGATGLNVARVLATHHALLASNKSLTDYIQQKVLNLSKYYEHIDSPVGPIKHFIIGSKYGENSNESIFDEMLKRSVIAVGFASQLDLTAYYGKEDDSLRSYLSAEGEEKKARTALRKLLSMRPGDLVAVKADGSPKGSSPFLSIVGLARVVEHNGEVYGHDPQGLGHTIYVTFYKAPVYHEFALGYGQTVHKLSNPEHIDTIFSYDYQIIKPLPPFPPNPSTALKLPLNVIFYGPPGTGKTYGALEHALTIFGIDVVGQERKVLKKLFDEKMQAGEVVFTTFHQNMSYEDFVEGIKPRTVNEKVIYEVEDGIFKSLCNKARPSAGNFDTIIESFKKEISELDSKPPITIKALTTSFDVVYRGTGVFNIQPHNTTKQNPWYPVNIQHIRKAFETDSYDGVYNPTYVREIIQFLIKNRGLVHSKGNPATPSPRVLIIDEINRGNVSQIFGELITLLEEDKREGHDETIAVVLPYSREVFRVPANVYIIGTMNTADRSVEALDTALRRRFSFRELPPRPEVISTHGKLAATSGILEGIDLALVLQTLNDRMEVLLNADNKIGHSYFLKVYDRQTLTEAFYQHIIPLLQEYFYGHPGKLGLVLGKGFVHVRFDESAAPVQFAAFDYEDVNALQRVVYELANPAALDIIKAVKILLNAA
jgi:hypothetical protein